MAKKYFFTIAFVSWMMFVTFSSLYSFSPDDSPGLNIPHLDKVVHFTFYFVACILGVLFLRERYQPNLRLKKALILMVVLTIVFGVVIEVLQYAITENRTGDFFDACANTLGSLCGVFAVKKYFSAKRGLKWKY